MKKFGRKSYSWFTSAVVFLVSLISILIVLQMHRLASLNQWVDHTDQVIANINLIEKDIVDLETGVRGFLLTGDSVFLEPYQKALLELPKLIESFHELVRDDRAQQEQMERIESLLEDWHKLAKEEITSRKWVINRDAVEQSLRGKELIDSIRKEVDKVLSREKFLREQRYASSQRQSIILNWSLLLTFLALLAFALYNFSKFIRRTRQLEESEEKFHTLAEALPQIVWITRADGWNIYFNHHWVEYTGLSLEESYGHGWNIPLHPDDQQRAWEAWQYAVQTDGIYSIECRLRRADGIYRWWLVRGVSLHDESGKVINWFGTCTDIEDLKRAKEELQVAEEKFKGLVETAPDAFIIVNESGRIEVVNQQAERWFGYDRGELIGKSIEILIPERFREKHMIERTEFVAGSQMRQMGTGLELYARRKNCSEFPVEISLSPMETPQGLLVTHIIRDISEKKKSERALRELNQSLERRVLERTEQLRKEIQQREESERIYRTIGESIDYGVWICAPDGRNTYASESFLRLVGITQEECSHFGWGKVLHPDDSERTIAAWKECVRGGGKWDIQHRFLGVDGKWHPILARGLPVKNEQGEIICWAGINLDIRELKETEDALRQYAMTLNRVLKDLKKSEETYRLTVESIRDYAISMLDPDGVILNWNIGAERINGYKASELVGKSIEVLFSEDDIRSGKPAQELKIAENEGRFEEEGRRIRRDGSEFWANVIISAVRDEKGNLRGFTQVVSDITEQMNAALALRKAKMMLESEVAQKTAEIETFKVLAESIPQLCWIAHADGFIFWYNQRWYNYTGTTPKDMEGWGWQSVHDPKLLPSVLERWRKSIESGIPFEMEFPLRGADGRFRWFLTRVLPLKDSDNRIINWFGTNTDIDVQKRALSEREELLKAVRAANDQLEQRVQDRTRDLMKSNKELEQFAYIASHDLQTPLRHIASFVQLLIAKVKKTTELDPQAEKWSQYIVSGTQQMKSLITDLLTYSRVGRVDISVEKLVMKEVVGDVLEALHEPIRKTHAIVKVGDLPEVFGVKSQLHQLFQNLIENAIKFKKPDTSPELEISCEDQGEYWKFYVSDNGIGFDPKFSDRIFAMFQRLHTTEAYTGTGIGLAVCKKIVEFHRGTIGADSAEGKGSTFYFSLPKIEGVTSRGASETQIKGPSGSGYQESA